MYARRKDDYAFFLQPVDPAQVPGYSDVIKHPMDLGTMSVKVEKGKYRTLEEFAVSVDPWPRCAHLFLSIYIHPYHHAQMLLRRPAMYCMKRLSSRNVAGMHRKVLIAIRERELSNLFALVFSGTFVHHPVVSITHHFYCPCFVESFDNSNMHYCLRSGRRHQPVCNSSLAEDPFFLLVHTSLHLHYTRSVCCALLFCFRYILQSHRY